MKRDSILAHCMARAVVAEAGGVEAATERWGADGSGLKAEGLWAQVKMGVRITPKASRVVGFIVLWAWAMYDEDRDEFTITEYMRRYNEGERQAYRVQSEFRELWPEFETPNELARQVVKYMRRRMGDGDAGERSLSDYMSVPVTA